MPEIEVEVEVWCERCGTGLCNESTGGSRHGHPCIYVTPCERCIDNAVREAIEAVQAGGDDE